MTIASLSFAFVQYTSTAALAEARSPAPAPAPAPKPVAQDHGHRGGCDSPRRSPLFRALKDALLEMAPAAQPAAAPSTTSTATTASNTTATGTSVSPAVTGTTAATQAAETTAAPAAAAPDLEQAMMDFARALMQTLRSEFRQGRGNDGEHQGRHHHHHHHRGHHGWGDPVQRVDALAQRVGAVATSSAPSAVAASGGAAPSASSAVASTSAADDATHTPQVGDVTVEPAVVMAAPAAAGGPQNTVIFVASINIKPASANAASPFSGLQQRLLDAFAGLQRAMGKPAAASSDSLKDELSTFLHALAQRLRGEDPATAEAATQPGALLSVAA